MPERTRAEILDREYLEMRAKILQLAASCDRMDRAGETTDESTPDERAVKLESGLKILLDDQPDKARRVQELFSRQYNESWRSEFGV